MGAGLICLLPTIGFHIITLITILATFTLTVFLGFLAWIHLLTLDHAPAEPFAPVSSS